MEKKIVKFREGQKVNHPRLGNGIFFDDNGKTSLIKIPAEDLGIWRIENVHTGLLKKIKK